MLRSIHLLSICLLSLAFTNSAKAQSITMVPEYDTVAPGDTMVWKFRLIGTKDSFSKFLVYDSKEFTRLGDLDEKNITVEKSRKDGSLYLFKSETEISLLMQAPTTEGLFQSGLASVVWNGKEVLHTEPVWISVRKGHKNKPIVSEKATTPNFRFNTIQFPNETLNDLLLADKHTAIATASKSFLIVVAWLYDDVVFRKKNDEMLQAINKVIVNNKNTKLIDSFYTGIAPKRFYYTTDDTTEWGNNLKSLAKNFPTDGKIVAIVTEPKDWSVLQETYAFEYELTKQLLLKELKKKDAFLEAKKQKKKFPLEVQFNFVDLKQMAAFVAHALTLGYKVSDQDTSITNKHPLYTTNLTRNEYADIVAINKSLSELEAYGQLENARAVLNGIGVAR